MALPALVGPAVQVGTSLVGGLINAGATNRENKRQREYNDLAYAREKQDNLDFWHMQNSYNSPEQQMQRLNQAGLNPNLVYGSGAVANSTSAPNVPHSQPYQPRIPQLNLPAVADQYFNIASRAQQISNEKKVGDNLLLQNELMKADLTSKKLNNTFNAETFDTKVRGFRGEAEGKYQSAIQRYLNTDLLEYLHGQSSTSITGRGITHVSQGDTSDSFLVKDWLQSHRSKVLGNTLKEGAAERNTLDNSLKSIQNKHQERLIRGNIEDISAQDWIKMLIQGLGIIPSYNRK